MLFAPSVCLSVCLSIFLSLYPLPRGGSRMTPYPTHWRLGGRRSAYFARTRASSQKIQQ